MKILIDIEDQDGETLDALAAEQSRSRTGQARHLLLTAIREAVAQPQPQQEETQA
jgi:hypothetical protein